MRCKSSVWRFADRWSVLPWFKFCANQVILYSSFHGTVRFSWRGRESEQSNFVWIIWIVEFMLLWNGKVLRCCGVGIRKSLTNLWMFACVWVSCVSNKLVRAPFFAEVNLINIKLKRPFLSLYVCVCVCVVLIDRLRGQRQQVVGYFVHKIN